MRNQSNLKIIVRGAYDVQKLRIQMGNRIVANFKAKLGQAPSTAEEELDEDAKKILANLRISYAKITDGVKTFPRQKSFKGDEVISSYTELCLIAQYCELERQEAQHFSRLKNVLNDYPIYNAFLEPTKGIGPAMAGVILSEIDIHKAKYPSSLWALAGLDTAVWFECKQKLDERAPNRIYKRHPEGYNTIGPAVVGDTHDHFLLLTHEGVSLGWYGLPTDAKGLWHGRSKKSEHLIRVQYTNSAGEMAERDSITFNPFLKTKLVGVLGPSFIKAGDNVYSRIYRDYKARLEANQKHAEKTKGHRHNMAIRYMIKRFLVDLHTAWRALEGVPVSEEYQVSKQSLLKEAA